MVYELYYWPDIQGRGEFVRLALEEAAVDYIDVARMPKSKGMGMPALMRYVDGAGVQQPIFAPPYLKVGELVIGQTANILHYLGARLGLAPRDEAGRLWVHQLQLTVADFISEVHDTHHPVCCTLYYEQQRTEAKRRSRQFLRERLPKYLGYFEKVLQSNPKRGGYMAGGRLSYADLSMFQLIEGLRYAFPRTMKAVQADYPGLVELHGRVAERPRIAAYLQSKRRIAFNEDDLFRRYPELDSRR